MIGWLLDTLVWTGALIALVLLVRRPVARHFGAQATYALWLIPFARLFLPPIELPAMFAPQAAPAPVAAIDPAVFMAMQAQPAPQPDNTWLWIALAFALWLTGAAVKLAWRYGAYFRMRARLLSEADEKLRIGGVRIVETSATTSPLAFGIIDKVIAVPAGFLDTADTRTRNLAIAHEMAHHERGDLIANFAVQPLFALHWFNPLGWLGWRALRRDQEAACDARVVCNSDDDTRAAYAQTIARYSAGPDLVLPDLVLRDLVLPDLVLPDLALAASMACPVLGEKSIIHRLRSLTMADISPRRRWAGRAALVTGLLALPLTASVTYAVPSQAHEARTTQDKTAGSGTAIIRDVDPDTDTMTEEQAEAIVERAEAVADSAEAMADAAESVEREMRMVFVKDGKVVTPEAMERKAKAMDRLLARMKERGAGDVSIRLDAGEARWVDAAKLAEFEQLGKNMARLKVRMEDPEWQASIAGLQDLTLKMVDIQMPRLLEMQRDLAEKGLIRDCTEDGKTVICTRTDVGALQRDAIAEARREIAANRDLSDAQRKRVLEALDKALSAN